MKRLITIGLCLLGIIAVGLVEGGIVNNQIVQAQQNKNLATGRMVFLCGATSQQVMDQMMPLIPKVTRDNYGFIYLNYSITPVTFTFQFYNDRLQGLMIWR